jgi:membrane peptidoglycan carboxypeptidase
MRQAIARSVNIPAIKTAEKVGLNNVINYAHMMGIKSEIEPYPPLAIGGIRGIRVLEMCSAYGVIASGGIFIEPTPIAKITDSQGQTIEPENVDKGKQVIQPKTAKVMDEMFRGVVMSRGGTGYAVRDVPEARGKTGTTNSDVDAWFIGYVPGKLVTAVWAGNDDHTPMKNVWGGNVCAPIWKNFMQKALRVYSDTHGPKPTASHEPEPKPQPANPNTTDNPAGETEVSPASENGLATIKVKICDDSQLLATSSCLHWHYERFADGSQPKEYCNIHGKKKRDNKPEGDNPPTDGETGGTDDDGLRLTPPPPMVTDH